MVAESSLQSSGIPAFHLDEPCTQCRYYIHVEIYMAYALAVSGSVQSWLS